MIHDRASSAHGFQIAFLIFAVVMLNAPLDKFIYGEWQWARDLQLPLGRPLMIASAGALLLAFPDLRRRCRALLAPPIPRGMKREVVVAVVLDYVASLGAFAAFALWHWSVGGEPALARSMGEYATHAAQMESALSVSGVVMFVFIAAFIGPIVEELVFRGFLYPAWKAAWGWVGGALASSLVFGLFHGAVVPQFLAGLVFIGVMRRTGSLRANIHTHALFNLFAWYPLLGQLLLPAGRSTGELYVWTPHLICLAITAIALPWYLWSARDARLPPPSTEFAAQPVS